MVISTSPSSSNPTTSNNTSISPVVAFHPPSAPSLFLWLSRGSESAVTLMTSNTNFTQTFLTRSYSPSLITKQISHAFHFMPSGPPQLTHDPNSSSSITMYYPGFQTHRSLEKVFTSSPKTLLHRVSLKTPHY